MVPSGVLMQIFNIVAKKKCDFETDTWTLKERRISSSLSWLAICGATVISFLTFQLTLLNTIFYIFQAIL